MITQLLIWWHQSIVDADCGEVLRRLKEHSASGEWMVSTITRINWRVDRIAALRAQRTLARAARWRPMAKAVRR